MRKLNRLPTLKGRMPFVYNPAIFADVVRIINAHSQVIDYLAERQKDRVMPFDIVFELTPLCNENWG